MKHLNKENINKNQVETIEQFKVLSYLKRTFNLDEIELYLYDKTTIKLIDKNKVQAYFKYNKQTKKFWLWKGYKSQLNCYEGWPVVYYWSLSIISNLFKIEQTERNKIALYLFNNIKI